MATRPVALPAPAVTVQDIVLDDEDRRELKTLGLALTDAQGFRLLLATYHHRDTRARAEAELRERLAQEGIRLVALDLAPAGSPEPQPDSRPTSLLDTLRGALDSAALREGVDAALSVTGLDWDSYRPPQDSSSVALMREANLKRETLAAELPLPLLLWLTPQGSSIFAQQAPDLWHWRLGTFELRSLPSRETPSYMEQSWAAETGGRDIVVARGSRETIERRVAELRDALHALDHARSPGTRERMRQGQLLLDLASQQFALAAAEHDGGDPEAALRSYEAAQATADRAMEHYKALAVDPTQSREPDLAAAFHDLALTLARHGRLRSALEASRRAVAFYEALANEDPAAYEADLARSLSDLSARLAEVGNRAGALEASRQAVSILEALTEQQPAAYGPDLAGSLNNLSNRLAEAGDPTGALEAIRRAVAIREALAEREPVAYQPDLGLSLYNLSLRLAEAGDRAEALEASRRAVGIYETLAEREPAAYQPHLAVCLFNLALELDQRNERSEALALATRARDLLAPHVLPGTKYADRLETIEGKLAAWGASGEGA